MIVAGFQRKPRICLGWKNLWLGHYMSNKITSHHIG